MNCSCAYGFVRTRKMSAVPFSQEVDGFQIPGMFSAENFRSALKYKPRSDDIFLATYPKCGTTWTGQILLLLLQKGEPLKKSSDILAKAPVLEMTGAEFVEKMRRPGPIKTHLPFHLTPWSEDAKYICVARNPKDCCVSYFHHLTNLPGHNFNGTFEEFFELFISGKTDYGDYFDHLMSWYPHRNEPNVLFFTYEELKEDLDAAILKMATFIDDEKYAEPIRSDSEILENIKKYSSLKEMKESMAKSFKDIAQISPDELKEAPMPDALKEFLVKQKDNLKAAVEGKNGGSNVTQFVRKGIVGDWRNYLTKDQNRRLEEKFAERTEGTDFQNLWKDYM
ncbi:sulfotransferase ssu-1 [Parasteatoda tepidariorum]|uniref:sulfotransferase ssu-1 n=1 Tax=Parasteatoda tepidariorum TaxID=114398 RepID=UPI001C723540|nr:sulfotransferase ssu-1 [Parasteatoda tepidariorum]